MFRKLVIVGIAVVPMLFANSTQLTPPEGIKYREEVLVQLGVKDLDRAVSFYTETLGFVLTERRNDLKFAHIDTNVSGLQIGLGEQLEPRGSGSVLINISVADVASARRALESKGIVFRGETQIIPGKVALAEFADPDGNRLRFAGPPPKEE
jgi:predicted enzyme related to lactoylglutathione lyase